MFTKDEKTEQGPQHLSWRALQRWSMNMDPGEGWTGDELQSHLESCPLCTETCAEVLLTLDEDARISEEQWTEWRVQLGQETPVIQLAQSPEIDRFWEFIDNRRKEFDVARINPDEQAREAAIQALMTSFQNAEAELLLEIEEGGVAELHRRSREIANMPDSPERRASAERLARVCRERSRNAPESIPSEIPVSHPGPAYKVCSSASVHLSDAEILNISGDHYTINVIEWKAAQVADRAMWPGRRRKRKG